MKLLSSFSIITLLASSFAFAENPDFNRAELGYQEIEDSDGYEFFGQINVSKDFFASLRFSDLSDNNNNDTETLSLGLGYIIPLSDSSSAYTTIEYRDYELNAFEDDGYYLGVGLRHNLSSIVELYGEIGSEDLDITGARTQLSLGSNYYLNQSTGIFIEYNTDDFHNNGYTLGARINF